MKIWYDSCELLVYHELKLNRVIKTFPCRRGDIDASATVKLKKAQKS